MATTLVKTDFEFPGQTGVYHGKVRDVYTIDNDIMVMIATDRISAFDVILPEGIPYKGQVLNQIAAYFLDASADIRPNRGPRREHLARGDHRAGSRERGEL